jgi:hypothetical protein
MTQSIEHTTETKQRLQESAQNCYKAYEEWISNRGTTQQEALQEALHELRKVTCRLEIDLAINDRQDSSSRPLPIPQHRSARNPEQQSQSQAQAHVQNHAQNNAPRQRDQQRSNTPKYTLPKQDLQKSGNDVARESVTTETSPQAAAAPTSPTVVKTIRRRRPDTETTITDTSESE